jgi:hypothetical protein
MRTIKVIATSANAKNNSVGTSTLKLKADWEGGGVDMAWHWVGWEDEGKREERQVDRFSESRLLSTPTIDVR